MSAMPGSVAARSSIARRSCATVLLGACLCGATATAQEAAPDSVSIDGRSWSLETGPAAPWAEADEFCETLEASGFRDWRLPTLDELEQLHAAIGRIEADSPPDGSTVGPFDFEDCCAWASENLATLPAERKGQLPAQSGAPESYYWGLLFDGGVSYYSNGRFDDGFALCTRDG